MAAITIMVLSNELNIQPLLYIIDKDDFKIALCDSGKKQKTTTQETKPYIIFNSLMKNNAIAIFYVFIKNKITYLLTRHFQFQL